MNMFHHFHIKRQYGILHKIPLKLDFRRKTLFSMDVFMLQNDQVHSILNQVIFPILPMNKFDRLLSEPYNEFPQQKSV